MSDGRLGIATELGLRRKLYGDYAYQPPIAALAKVHHISVNAKTGQRTVKCLGVVAPIKAQPAPVAPPEQVPVPVALRPRNCGDWRRLTDDGVQEHVKAILRATAAAFDVGVVEMMDASRAQRLALPRFAAMILMRKLARLSLTSIGRVLHRDHTTCLAGISKALELRRTNPDFRRRSIAIVKALRAQAGAQR